MKSDFDIAAVMSRGHLSDELEYERALIADRKLRLLVKENSNLKSLRSQLRELIHQYESKTWSGLKAHSEDFWNIAELAELVAEKERQFIFNRKLLIKKKLKENKLTQKQLADILGHKSHTHMSELMNGLSPFVISDLVLIHRLLKIDLENLIPTTITNQQRKRVHSILKSLGNSELDLGQEEFKI